MTTKKVLGIGNALVDNMIRLEDETLLKFLKLPKGSMQLVDTIRSEEVAKASAHLKSTRSSGGSASNTIHGLARLGVETAFIGHVGEDETGKFFQEDMIASGIKPLLFSSKTASGIAHAFVTKDGERTFATYLGAAIELSESHLKENLFVGYDYFYIEGYLVQNKALLKKAIELAAHSGAKIAIDLASYNVVEDQREFLLELLDNKTIDIVFANEEEAKALTGLNPNDALDFIADRCETAVVKIGKGGSLIKQKGIVYPIAAVKANAIDTTGAGDMYAAGFLYGISKQLSLVQAGQIGSLLAGHVIEVVGAKMSHEQWTQIKKQIKQIEAV
ncbi:MAG: adenosine kinase [Bacteroidales bacterium]|nr:adenosine kinase [Bacteroidales bacterium]HOI32462.1 adenosine kinase [Bacteroidales bacterium]